MIIVDQDDWNGLAAIVVIVAFVVFMLILFGGGWMLEMVRAFRGDPAKKAELELKTAEQNRLTAEARERSLKLEQNRDNNLS